MSKKTVNDFALGKASYPDLSQVAIGALRKRAGYVPGKIDAPLPETLEVALELLGDSFIDEDVISAWIGVNPDSYDGVLGFWHQMALARCARRDDKVFVPDPNSIVDHAKRPRINGVMSLQHMPYKRELDRDVESVLKWCEGRAWVAGSAVVQALAQTPFTFGDIDVFCHSDRDYEVLKEMALARRPAKVLAENERSVLIESPLIVHVFQIENLNLVRPCGEDWSEPYNVLKDFDLTCSAALARNTKEAFVWKVPVFEKYTMHAINLKHPAKTLGRVMKYWSRGFTPSAYLWDKLAQDERCLEMMLVMSPLADVFQSPVLDAVAYTTRFYEPHAQSSFDEYEYYEDEWDYE